MGKKAGAFPIVLAIAPLLGAATMLPEPEASLPPWQVCKDDGHFTAGSQYQRNVGQLSISLPNKIASSKTLFATSSVGKLPNMVHSMALCRGDLNATSCRSCVAAAFVDAEQLCPFSTDATVFHETCYVRYSNEGFLSTTKDNILAIHMNDDDQSRVISSSRVDLFDEALGLLLNATIRHAAERSARFFGTGEIGFGSSDETIYALVQCTPDMPRSDCLVCLQKLVTMLTQYSGSPSGTIQGVRCGFSYAMTKFFSGGETLQLPALEPSPPPINVEPSPPPVNVTPRGGKRAGTKIIMIVLMSAAGCLLLIPCICLLVWHLLCKRTRKTDEIEALMSSHGSVAPKRYRYAEITKITCSFNNRLGEGGYGVVYKGTLQDGRSVAVKLLNDSKTNGEEFLNEVMSIGRTSHVNIVSLFGFCLEGSKRALIYEYMPNCSLDKYIYSENPKSILGWENLYTIAFGVARGLEYLHDSCNTRIVHFDIKPQNILLDHNFNPKIADFGLAKLCHSRESKLSVTGARGTIGFIAPELHSRTFGTISTKSDVYSYGMMLLEMVGGRKNVKSAVEKSSQEYFPEWIYDHFQYDGLQACEVTQEVEEIAKKMSLIGLWYIQILPMHRPTITEVLEMFQRGSDELIMPPKQNFSQILEDSPFNISVDGTSKASQKKACSEVVRIKEMSPANSKILHRLPTL